MAKLNAAFPLFHAVAYLWTSTNSSASIASSTIFFTHQRPGNRCQTHRQTFRNTGPGLSPRAPNKNVITVSIFLIFQRVFSFQTKSVLHSVCNVLCYIWNIVSKLSKICLPIPPCLSVDKPPLSCVWSFQSTQCLQKKSSSIYSRLHWTTNLELKQAGTCISCEDLSVSKELLYVKSEEINWNLSSW